MATVLLVRHGRTTANASGVLAGRQKGIHLDDTGIAQAAAVAERLTPVKLAAVVSSPLERCRQTAVPIARAAGLKVGTDRGLVECDYGDWQGRTLKELMKEKLWATIQAHPSAATFPGGESMGEMIARSAAAVRRRDATVEAEHGAGAVWVAVSHGDIIKGILADALGMHLDLFQRINIDPGAVSIIRYTSARPYVLGMNTHAGDLSWLNPPTHKGGSRRKQDGAPVGGGAGPGTPT